MFQVSRNFVDSDPIATVPSAVANSHHYFDCVDAALEVGIHQGYSVEDRIGQRFQLQTKKY
jgi:hypothetical protein